MGAKPEMRRIAAARVVAGMKSAETGWPFAGCKPASNDMRMTTSLSQSRTAIACFVDRSCPRPAFVGATAVNLGPEQGNLLGSEDGRSRIDGSHVDLLQRLTG